MNANMSWDSSLNDGIAALFRILGQPVRVRILLVIGQGEACVCHLEAYLGLRQAAISQHLMVLRDADLVTTVRDGRNIFYRLARPELLEMVRQAARLAGISMEALEAAAAAPAFPCPCPHCNPEHAAGLDCSNLRVV
jgi:DNA-binding transcriptional ArsR family regulator